MPRTAVTATTVGPNAETSRPAGTTIDATLVTNGVIVEDIPLEELVLEVTNTFAGAKNVTVQSGANPPALSAGQGDLVVSLAQNDVSYIGPFTSGRFIQSDGSLHVDFENAMTGTIRVLRIPRTA